MWPVESVGYPPKSSMIGVLQEEETSRDEVHVAIEAEMGGMLMNQRMPRIASHARSYEKGTEQTLP